jgi:hypothetical protein
MKPLKNRVVQAVAVLGVVATLALVTPRAAHALAAALVQVTNTPADPVPNKDVDVPARHAYAATCSGVGLCSFPTVLAGTELVIQTLVGAISPCPGAAQAFVQLQTTTGGFQTLAGEFIFNLTGPGFGAAVTQSFTAYADPGTAPICAGGAVDVGEVNPPTVTCFITGYTVSLP